VLKNLAHLNGLNTIQFAVVFYDQGAIYLCAADPSAFAILTLFIFLTILI
jgi:hypothetical protein